MYCGECFTRVLKMSQSLNRKIVFRVEPFFCYPQSFTEVAPVWFFVFVILCHQQFDGKLCVFAWSILRWSWERTVLFLNHSPILSRLSPFRRYQSLVKVSEIVLDLWHDHKRFCFSHHSSMSSNSESPSSVRSLRSFSLCGMCSLYHFATHISSARNSSISPGFGGIGSWLCFVHVVDLVIGPTVHWYTVLLVGLSQLTSFCSLWRPISALMSASSLRGSPLCVLTFTNNVTVIWKGWVSLRNQCICE
jgi:hypothetical protein